MKRYNNQTIVGMILAGGKSRRMNFNDKSLQKINKYSLIDRVIVRAKKQVDYLLINSNSDHIKNNYNEYIVIKDTIKGNLGPLAGVLSGLEWIKKKDSEINWLITFPVDSPFFPSDLVDIFLSHVNEEQIIVAESNSRIHPVFAMWNKIRASAVRLGSKSKSTGSHYVITVGRQSDGPHLTLGAART